MSLDTTVDSKNQVTTLNGHDLDIYNFINAEYDNSKITELLPTKYPIGDIANFINSGETTRFYKINKLSFDKDFPKREAFENVIASVADCNCNFVYILSGDELGVSIYVGLVKNSPSEDSDVSSSRVVKKTIEGNFNGSDVVGHLSIEDTKKYIFDPIKKYRAAGVITGIPSINKSDKNDETDFQGIDRIINSMLGTKWRIVVVCNRVQNSELVEYKNQIYNLYDLVSLFQKRSHQYQESQGNTETQGTSSSDSRSKSQGTNTSEGTNKSHSSNGSSSSSSRGSNSSQGTSESKSESHSDSSSSSTATNKGSSNSVTIEVTNKKAQEIIKYIDEELLERLRLGISKGMYKTTMYYMAGTPDDATNLKHGIISLFQGNKSSFSPLVAHDFNFVDEDGDIDTQLLVKTLSTFQNQIIKKGNANENMLALLGFPVSKDGQSVDLCTYLTGQEVSLLASLPQSEVPGITLKESISFGLNSKGIEQDKTINLGLVVSKGRVLEKINFNLDRDCFLKHTFIAGTTGSGKTTTCLRLLLEANSPFLVIEPAKTEYRTLLNDKYRDKFNDVYVFTVGNETCAPLRLNPFELIEGEIISSHIDMVKATFTTAFPMEASMPQLLEEAIYLAYKKKGWNVDTNHYKNGEDPFAKGVNSFPTMSDLISCMNKVVEEKGFASDLKNNYIGSLVSRLSNLTVGSKGALLNCSRSTDFEFIAKNRVILEIENLKSSEDKALIMGFVLARLSEEVKKLYRESKGEYKHITLVEEAHRLLSKVEFGDSGAKKGAVEAFTDMLAEIRKYGEGMIIVDQIPNKLASEVLKNTNTKIIHRIFSKDDKDAVGDTMFMNEKQRQYLSSLEVGQAVVFSENTEIPVHVQVTPIVNTSDLAIEDSKVKDIFLNRVKSKDNPFGDCYDDLAIRSFYNTLMDSLKQARIYWEEGTQSALKKFEQEQKEVLNEVDNNMRIYEIPSRKDIFDIVAKFYQKQTGNSENKEVENAFSAFLTDVYTSDEFKKNLFDYETDATRFVKRNVLCNL